MAMAGGGNGRTGGHPPTTSCTKMAHWQCSGVPFRGKYFNICEIKEHLDDNASEYLEYLAKLKTQVDQKEFKSDWFANIGTLNWQEKLELQSQATGSKTKLLSNARALCVGGGYRYSNAFHGIEISACGFSGSAKVTAKDDRCPFVTENYIFLA